jgi:NCS1 family nucleobase:cation symporter-1
MGSGEPSQGLGHASFAFVMFSMASCLPLFFLGPIAYRSGLTLSQALLAALAGNAVVAVAMALNGVYGVERRLGFPEQAREVYGSRGSKAASALRGLVGALWFGVEAYNGALALVMMVLLALGIEGQALIARATPLIPAALTLYLGLMLLVTRRGVEAVGRAASLAGPLMLAYFAWLAWWLHGHRIPPQGTPGSRGVPWLSAAFLGYLALQTNWWATVAVNISDLSRLARSWGAVWSGVFLGMVGGQLLGTYLGYELASMTGRVLPQEIVAAYAPGALAVSLGLLFSLLAPWTTDITANVPALIDLITENLGLDWGEAAVAAVLSGFILAPWWALDKAQGIVGYVSAFASSYGILLGPLLGPMIAHQWLCKPPRCHGSPRAAAAAVLVGVAASYLAALPLGSPVALRIHGIPVPLPPGLSWYPGVAASLLAYPLLARIPSEASEGLAPPRDYDDNAAPPSPSPEGLDD